jgi:hypothetical protein
MEKLTEVLIWSFPKIDISSVMQIETQGLKNKVFKTQGREGYLTLKKIRHGRHLHIVAESFLSAIPDFLSFLSSLSLGFIEKPLIHENPIVQTQF